MLLSNRMEKQVYTHLKDAVVCPFCIHDSSMGGEGPEPQRKLHQLLVVIFHQMVLHITASAKRQRVAICRGQTEKY